MNKYTKIRLDKAKQEQVTSDERRLKRALKSANLPVIGASPAQELAALEKYIGNLLKLRVELVSKYGEDKYIYRVDSEMQRAVEQIAQIRVYMIKPELAR